MLRKSVFALLALAIVGLLSPTVASARGGGGGFHGGGFHGGFGGFHGFHGFHGRGLAFGAGVGLGLYDPYAYPYYGPDAYPYDYSGVYEDDGGCIIVRRRIHTRNGWRVRPVQVCG